MEVDNDKSQMLKVAKCNFFQGENTEISILIVLKMMMIGGWLQRWIWCVRCVYEIGFSISRPHIYICKTITSVPN